MESERREALFQQVLEEYGAALARLTRGYERIEERRVELEQEIFLNIWRALPSFRGDASLRTWMYRIAHNVATRHMAREMGQPSGDDDDEVDEQPISGGVGKDLDARRARGQLRQHIAALRPLDRQLMMLYLEDVPQGEIAEVTGLSQANVSTRIHRIKQTIIEAMT